MKNTTIDERMNEVENVRALRELVDTFSILADKKEIQKQTLLFTKDATVETYLNGKLISKLQGTQEIEDSFENFLEKFETVYHFNGQHTVSIDQDKATGTLYCMVYLFNSENGKKIKTTSGVHYKDKYVLVDGQWLIAKRISVFAWQDRQEVSQ